MTNQEAIEAIKLARSQVEWDYPMDYAAAFDKAIEALEQEPTLLSSELEKNSKLEKIKAEIERQEKWLMDAGYNQYNVDIALDTIKSVVDKYKAEMENT